MIAGEQARIVIDIEASYKDKVPDVLPGVEIWSKVGKQWNLVIREFRPHRLPDGSRRYEIQDTEQNRLTAMIFWKVRGCTVKREVPDFSDPFPAKEQKAWLDKDLAEREADSAALVKAEKAVAPLEKKQEKITNDLIRMQSRLDKTLELADYDQKKPKKEIVEPLEKEVDKLEKAKAKIDSDLEKAIELRRVLRIKA
jgi:hypothetical protein